MAKRTELKNWFIVLYFCFSFFALSIIESSPLWVMAGVVVNFGFAAWLTTKVKSEE